ncbi:hypothetical protein AZI86_02415 [Bdellovibrio bacteriovorus]|uniref:UspA domain-containing protein n=2 Tax=Bdellovibrio bacteriovorus TaxID=959 RepID=A0A150WP32_BDEBC|nr:hypothetical protein AZI86_02415 [Bdellovibrio bacteriovorus]
MALNPKAAESTSFKNFCTQINTLQKKGLLSKVNIVSLIHPNFFAMPSDIYFSQKETLMNEVEKSLATGLGQQIAYSDLTVLESPYSSYDEMVGFLSQLAYRQRDSVIIVGIDPQQKVYKWLAGGLPETAALSAQIPILLVKVDQTCLIDKEEPRVVLAVDTEAPPTKKALRRFARLVRPLGTPVDILHVQRKANFVASLIGASTGPKESEAILASTLEDLRSLNLDGKIHTIEEEDSVAATIAKFANNQGAWITATSSPTRDIRHRLVWGSTTQNLLEELSCPLLVLRSS